MPKVPTKKPKEKQPPDTIRPYLFHGLDLDWERGDEELITDCPFCGRERKFSVNSKTGQWRCFICGEGTDKGGGNVIVFLRKLHETSLRETTQKDYESLAKDRKIEPDTFISWNLAYSSLTRDWLIPGYSAEGSLNTLYRYYKPAGKEKRIVIPTPTLGHYLFGRNVFDPNCGVVYLAEGPWSSMALWEVMRVSKTKTGGGQHDLAPTGNVAQSLLSFSNVLGLPGIQSFGSVITNWLPLFAGKTVAILLDNDWPKPHPRDATKLLPPAAYEALKKLVGRLGSTETPPSEIYYLRWADEGFDRTQPDGHDVRDLLRI